MEDAIKYETKVFDNAFPLSEEETSIYQRAPSPEGDKAWEALYNGKLFKQKSISRLYECSFFIDVGVLRIPESSAKQLPNTTYPFTNDPGYYIASLAVFHHLHCLVCSICPSHIGRFHH